MLLSFTQNKSGEIFKAWWQTAGVKMEDFIWQRTVALRKRSHEIDVTARSADWTPTPCEGMVILTSRSIIALCTVLISAACYLKKTQSKSPGFSVIQWWCWSWTSLYRSFLTDYRVSCVSNGHRKAPRMGCERFRLLTFFCLGYNKRSWSLQPFLENFLVLCW